MTNDDTPTQRFQTDSATTRTGLASGQRVFGRYLLEAQVGRGGMGVVWRARDEKLDRPVALKFLPPEVAADVEAVRDLKLETKRCLDLTHVNIVRVYDFIEEEGSAAIAMEYIEGESLAKIKAAAPGGCLAASDLTPFVAQLCAALRYAHQVAKVAHHDLKPANVLVTHEGVLKVTDFGIARSLTDTRTRLTSKAGNTSGTLPYMSPQQLAGDKPTAADDIYALGAMLYELLTGKPPFFRGDAVSVRQQAMERTPAPLEAHRRDVNCTGPAIPPAWSETILACLAKKPEDRPATADEVASRFGLALEPMPTATLVTRFQTAVLRAQPAQLELMAPARRSLVPLLLLVGTLLLAGTAAGIYYGITVPEQARLAAEQERAHQAELALQAERIRQAEQQRVTAEEQRKAAEAQALAERQKQEAVRAQAARDQQTYAAMTTKIAALPDNPTGAQALEAQRMVRNYLRTAPNPFRDLIDKAFTDREAAWRALAAASRPGTLTVETDPVGATVVLYPRNEKKTSPAVFDEVKPGDISLHIEKEGYEAKDVPFVVKPGVTNKVEPVKLLAIYGSIAITSEPADLYVLVEGIGRRLEGRTPFTPTTLPPGDYRITVQRTGWHPLVKTIAVEKGKIARYVADMKGVTFELRTTPPGAQITIDRHPVGPSPIAITGLEPRDYVVTATLDGYEVLTKTVTFNRPDFINLPLVEKPLPRALRRVAGVRWHYDAFASSAELTITPQGKITGSHHSGLGGKTLDLGTMESYNSNTSTFVARFAAPAGGKPYYPGAVQIKFADDDHLVMTWKDGSSTEHLTLERDKPAAPK